jgi:hypothetical protein
MRLSRETGIGVAVSALAVGAMAIDHLIGTEQEPGDEPGLADPAAFLISVALSLALAAFLFGVVVRRAVRDDDADRAASKAISLSLPALPAMALLFLGLPFPLAGAGVALGLLGREGARRRIATTAVVIGVLVIAVGAGAYVGALVA